MQYEINHLYVQLCLKIIRLFRYAVRNVPFRTSVL